MDTVCTTVMTLDWPRKTPLPYGGDQRVAID